MLIQEHQNSLEEIETYIKDRRVEELAALYTGLRQKHHCRRMFFYYDKTGARRDGVVSIVLREADRIVVRTQSQKHLHDQEINAVYVFGIDNNFPWVHRLQWPDKGEFENARFKWTRNAVNQFMGFFDDLRDSFEMDKVYRIQGDLCIRQLKDWKSYVEETFKNSPKQDYAGFIAKVKAKSAQCNQRIGNHLIIIGNCRAEDMVVCEETQCHVIHDEHQSRSFKLPAGRYEFSLLRRHITDERR
jgi:hypothetical protein